MTGRPIAVQQAAPAPLADRHRVPAWLASRHLQLALVALAAFGVYWASSFHLEAAHRTTHFAADTWFYAELAKGDVLGRLTSDYHLDRIVRFHPTTVLLAAAWMEIVHPLAQWIEPRHLLKALFAAVGAAGVWAALCAFAAVVPRRYAIWLGAIYASSLSIWYFSSIEESKIVAATLTGLYIAAYLRLRTAWTPRGAALLTGILLVACLNEIVAAFLLVIPVVDTLAQRGWRLRELRWIAGHALAAPVALAILEAIMRGRMGAAGYHPEGANHLSMFLYYLAHNDYSMWSLHAFAVKWLLFSIAAPSRDASYLADASINYGGDFEPIAAHYLASPLSASLVVLLTIMLIASVLPWRRQALGGLMPILLALLAYAVVRGLFFLVFIPYECILFSAPVVLAHILVAGLLFTTSRFPAKQALLASVAMLLLVTNAAFILGQ
jgi:hypothetical protein